MLIFEVFERRIREQYRPEDGSEIDELLKRGDELEARREALQPDYTAAAERAKTLTAELTRPVRAVGPNGNAAQEARRKNTLDEWAAALAAESKVAAELSDLARQVTALQVEVTEMLTAPAVSERARGEAREKALGR